MDPFWTSRVMLGTFSDPCWGSILDTFGVMSGVPFGHVSDLCGGRFWRRLLEQTVCCLAGRRGRRAARARRAKRAVITILFNFSSVPINFSAVSVQFSTFQFIKRCVIEVSQFSNVSKFF